jgi:hypothetical protein
MPVGKYCKRTDKLKKSQVRVKRRNKIKILISILVISLILLNGRSHLFNKMDGHLAQTKNVLDKDIPQDMWEKIKTNNKSETKLDYLKYSYYEVGNRYTSEPRYYLREPYSKFWVTDVKEIWEGTADRPSTVQNYMLKLLLVKSGKFSEEDIVGINMYYGITPHQYLKVKINGEWIDVDVWDKEQPHKFGELTC